MDTTQQRANPPQIHPPDFLANDIDARSSPLKIPASSPPPSIQSSPPPAPPDEPLPYRRCTRPIASHKPTPKVYTLYTPGLTRRSISTTLPQPNPMNTPSPPPPPPTTAKMQPTFSHPPDPLRAPFPTLASLARLDGPQLRI